MEAAAREIGIERAHPARDLLLLAAQRRRHDRQGERDAVLGIVVGDLGDRHQRRQRPVGVAAVRRIGAGRERIALLAAIRRRAGVLAVDHVRGDRQHRLRVHRAAIGRIHADLVHHRRDELLGDVVGAIVVVAEAGKLPVDLEVDDQALGVAHRLDLCVLDRRQAVGGVREASDAAGERPQHVAIVQRHLDRFVAILVVHVVDAVQRVDVGLRQPVHHGIEPFHDLVVVEQVTRHGPELRPDLLAAHLVAAAVQGIEHRLGQVHARAEELHLLADAHRRDAAGDRAVVAELGSHQVVGFVLDRARVDRRLDGEGLEALGQPGRPEDGQVGFGCRPEIVQGVEHAERRLRDERAAVLAHTAQHLGHPHRIAGEELIVFRRAQEAHDAPLDHHVVDEFLGLLLGQLAGTQVALDIDVPEGREPAGRHGRAVLLLDRGEVGEIGPLDGVARRNRWSGDVVSVALRHLLQFLERADLLAQLLAQPDVVLGGMTLVDLVALAFLVGDQEIDAVQGDPAIVADDAAAAVRVWQAGDDARRAGLANIGRIGVEHTVIVGLAILAEDLTQCRIRRVAVGLQARRHDAPAAERHDGPLERRVGLQADDQLVGLVDISRRMGQDAGWHLGHVQDPLLALLCQERLQRLPEATRAVGGACQEIAFALVRRIVALNELAQIDPRLPAAGGEACPGIVVGAGRFGLGLGLGCHSFPSR